MNFPSDSQCAGLRVDDIGKAAAVVADMRKIIRQDPRIIQKLHRRVFIDKLTREQACYRPPNMRCKDLASGQQQLSGLAACGVLMLVVSQMAMTASRC